MQPCLGLALAKCKCRFWHDGSSRICRRLRLLRRAVKLEELEAARRSFWQVWLLRRLGLADKAESLRSSLLMERGRGRPMQFETFAKRLFFSLSTTTATATDALVRALKVETLRWNQNCGLVRFTTSKLMPAHV